MDFVFGPVPSRRLGSSLGINHIPPKHCTYSCVYCQVGRTTHMDLKRREFYPVDQILVAVDRKIAECARAGVEIDYLTLVPDGEPTLDLNLGKLIVGLKQFKISIAVISNASLIDRLDVQDDLLQADWVSLKVDTVDEQTWKAINRPHHQLSLPLILDGMLSFRKKYCGELVTETMLVGGMNDNEQTARQLCTFLLEMQPFKSYLSIPTRPPAESAVTPPTPDALREIMRICSDQIPFMGFLFETEVGDFISTGDLKEDILSITAVHPLREEALREMVSKASGTWKVVEDLLASDEIACVPYREERYYLRHFTSESKRGNHPLS